MDTRRGICVLSHTNVARNEIERKLGSTAEGQALLSYPHFIGTIHGFVDRFLGIPWIKTCGFPVEVVDSDITLSYRWQKIERKYQYALENKGRDEQALRITGTDFNLEKLGVSNSAKTYGEAVTACRTAAESGYFCYEDPLLWGHELTKIAPETIAILRTRFPVLFIDEAQDNSELQASILHRVFIDGETGSVCQRFGDANQAIFHSVSSKDTPKTWVFPNKDIKRDIPDSYRFGQAIAVFAAPLAVEPQNLTGRGPDQRKAGADIGGQHTIFLFEDDARVQVLPAFTDHLRAIFSRETLEKGSFVAVGGKHKKPDNEKNKPNSVCDYWDAYVPEQTKADPRPDTFVGYVQAGRAKLYKDGNGNLHPMIESIAAGVLEAVRRSGGQVIRRQLKSRYIREVLPENKNALASYSEFLRCFAVDREALTRQVWNDKWKRKIGEVVAAVFEGEAAYHEPQEFLNWPDVGADASMVAKAGTIYQKDEQLPKIRLGSIHSVKRETHTGVLVLETYWQKGHYHAKLKNWLLEKKQGGNGEGVQNLNRLRLHYVAMTRPTHLLCLALPSGTFTPQEIITLLGRGWRIARIAADGRG